MDEEFVLKSKRDRELDQLKCLREREWSALIYDFGMSRAASLPSLCTGLTVFYVQDPILF